MKSSRSWCWHLWMAIGLRGRLVAGYTALFAVLLLGIAVGETTVVRQVLIDDRKAQFPGTASGQISVQGTAGGSQGATVSVQGPGPVLGNNEMVLASFAADGTRLSWHAGYDVRNVDPRQLLDPRYAGNDAGAPIIYQTTVGGTAYLVQVQTIPMMMKIGPTRTTFIVPPGADGAPAPEQSGTGGATAPGQVRTMGAIGATTVTMLTAESLRSVDDTVHTLLLVTLTASGLGLLLAAIVGLAVARRALRPLERMTATAQAIAAGGNGALDRRLRLPAHGDEVSRLATTFDKMLDRVQDTIAERVRSETRMRHFAADASHELRTPLAAVSGYTEVLLLGGKDDPETSEHVLRQMNSELARMNRLVGDLLTLARLEAGLPMHAQALPVAPLLEGLVEETRLLAARAGRDLAIVAGSQTGESDALAVLADPDRLHQILLNLLHNAVKFTPDGGRITVRAARQHGKVALSVTDTGPGIAAAELPLLFGRFYRSDKARARADDAEAGGAGLGLAIAQGLAQAQGGHIEVASAPGAGSTFTVVLPAAPSAG